MTEIGKRKLARFWFYFVVVILVVSIWSVRVYEYHKIFGVPGTIFSGSSGTPSPSDWQKMLAETMASMNSLLTTLCTGLLGAVGLLMVKAREGVKLRHMWAAFLAAISGGVSLYFGYASHLSLLAMVNNENLSAYDPVYLFSTQAQFYTLLAGAFFLADFAFQQLNDGA